jgi:hypothetical protein
MPSTPSLTAAAAEDRFVSVSRMSYAGIQNAVPTRPVWSQSMEKQAMLQNRSRSPKFVAMTNYEMSFQEAQQPSPVRKSCKPEFRQTVARQFVETSTSRASFNAVPVDVLLKTSKRVTRAEVELAPVDERHAAPFAGNSESRRSFVEHGPVTIKRAKMEHRALPNVKFTAQSTNRAEFVAHALPPISTPAAA